MTQPIPILMYHSVDTASSGAYARWVVSPGRFADQMAVLAAEGWRPVTVFALASALATGAFLPPRTVVLTFDDGLRDFLLGAVPVLERHGFPATLFVVAGLVGATARWLAPLGEGRRPMLGWRELAELEGAGIECGAHTVTHPQLDILPMAAAREEIGASKRMLEDGLGRRVASFAYPHGYASKTTRRLVREAGFASACRVHGALSSTMENRYALSRIVMTEAIGPGALSGVLEGRGLPRPRITDRAAAFGWRLARQARHWTQQQIAGATPSLSANKEP